jgi:curved DNA-binding protein CbpA
LNLNFGASETEIKKRFRKLATIYHPDKNGGSAKSEETFKVILNAYEVLSDKNKRFDYDNRYRQYFHRTQSETTTHYQTKQDTEKNHKQRQAQNQDRQQKHNPPKQKPATKTYINYVYWLIFVIFSILYLYNSNKKTTTGNTKADEQLEQQTPQNRPQSGELDFKK